MNYRDVAGSTLDLVLCSVILWYGVKVCLCSLLVLSVSLLETAVQMKHYDHESKICVEEIAQEASLVCEP
jgi:hypothetical protein